MNNRDKTILQTIKTITRSSSIILLFLTIAFIINTKNTNGIMKCRLWIQLSIIISVTIINVFINIMISRGSSKIMIAHHSSFLWPSSWTLSKFTLLLSTLASISQPQPPWLSKNKWDCADNDKKGGNKNTACQCQAKSSTTLIRFYKSEHISQENLTRDTLQRRFNAIANAVKSNQTQKSDANS